LESEFEDNDSNLTFEEIHLLLKGLEKYADSETVQKILDEAFPDE
jgi:hypothetical protein